MSNQFQAVRGMSDLLPEQTRLWQYVERLLIDLAEQYQYQQIRFPIVEKTELFCRTIGEVTDIVEKEMYVFNDRNGESLALRPEGTAGCVRACLEHSLIARNTQKLWYLGPMFRHERPQKGRYRQFYQFGLEAFGFDTPDIDAELLLFTARLWQLLGIDHQVRLQINSLGSLEARNAFKAKLVDFYQEHRQELDEDSLRRLTSNPLRILDSKNPQMQALNQQAPQLLEHLDQESKEHFTKLCQILDANHIAYDINPFLVRGLDYYGKTVFEWVTDSLGAQGTICAGGRYDKLIEQLGGKQTPAIGLAMGLERIIGLLEQQQFSKHQISMDIFFITLSDNLMAEALAITQQLRCAIPGLTCYYQPGFASLKNQMKKADKSGATLAIILGEDEHKAGKVAVKFLRDQSQPQMLIDVDALVNYITQVKRSSHG